MKHPILLALGAGLLVLLLALGLVLLRLFSAPLSQPASGAALRAEQRLPWQAQARADGSLHVLGLVLGQDRLADAQARIGDGLQVALVARLGEVGRLEALAEPFAAGFVSGRLVLAFDVAPATLQRWRARATGSAPMDGGVRRFALHAADRDEAQRAALVGLSFVPALRLTEADVRQRFGAPLAEGALDAAGFAGGAVGAGVAGVAGVADAAGVAGGASEAGNASAETGAKVLLYPAIGLAASVGPGRRGVLQFVAPAEFEARLRAPLAGHGAASAAGLAPAVPRPGAASGPSPSTQKPRV